jgi:LysR family hca operon transcriptional activator
MELRHLRYFVAVAEEGSLTLAAEHRLHTAQPSLSRQIRDLELEVGAELLTRSARGVELTAAGRAFLDHARLALAQVDAAKEAARRAALPDERTFAFGFLSGHELEWLGEAMRILQEELPRIEVTISSNHSPALADALLHGRLDVAFLRREADTPDLVYKLLRREPLVIVMPGDHRLASREAVDPKELAGEPFLGMSETAPVLRRTVTDYFRRSGLDLSPAHEVDYLSMAISLVASTRAVTLLPIYALNFLPPSVISRPLTGDVPTVELVLGYHKANTSPLLRLFLSKLDDLIERVSDAPAAAGQLAHQ